MTQEIGAKHFAAIEAYFRDGGIVPTMAKSGYLNLSELVRITGVPRSSFYQHDAIAQLVEDACIAQGINRQPQLRQGSEVQSEPDGSPASSPNPKTRQLEKRVHRLETQNAGLMAENAELRRQLKQLHLQLGREDMQIDSGRRIPPPGAHT